MSKKQTFFFLICLKKSKMNMDFCLFFFFFLVTNLPPLTPPYPAPTGAEIQGGESWALLDEGVDESPPPRAPSVGKFQTTPHEQTDLQPVPQAPSQQMRCFLTHSHAQSSSALEKICQEMLSIYLPAWCQWLKRSWKYRKVSLWSCFAASKNTFFFFLNLPFWS